MIGRSFKDANTTTQRYTRHTVQLSIRYAMWYEINALQYSSAVQSGQRWNYSQRCWKNTEPTSMRQVSSSSSSSSGPNSRLKREKNSTSKSTHNTPSAHTHNQTGNLTHHPRAADLVKLSRTLNSFRFCSRINLLTISPILTSSVAFRNSRTALSLSQLFVSHGDGDNSVSLGE